MTQRRSVAVAEAARPELEQRLTTFSEKQQEGTDPFIELLAADTLRVAREGGAPESFVPKARLMTLAGVGGGCLAGVVWVIAAGAGVVGDGGSLVWTGAQEDVAPRYGIRGSTGGGAGRGDI